ALETNEAPTRLRVVAFGRRLELEAEENLSRRRPAPGGPPRGERGAQVAALPPRVHAVRGARRDRCRSWP
ncbi:hypothetical protein ACFTY7_14150, partial [Streptomyces sp. NPDC057062]|uniref:hypothetical protein n=1 Tax=Streptomyces sp. NPDC057062 TaxID=3346011 RepID=UPI00362D02BF